MAQAQNTSQDAVSGLQPLSYLNQNQPAVVLFVRLGRAPKTTDRRFKFGTIWLDTASNAVYALVNVKNNEAFWSLLGQGGGDLESLTGNTGGAVFPNGGNINVVGSGKINVLGIPPVNALDISISGVVETLTGDTGGAIGPDILENINILGGENINVVGAGNTLTISSDAGGFPITPFVVGVLGDAGFQTIQAALDAANLVGGGIIGVQPGTFNENLILHDNTFIVGLTNALEDAPVLISGIHSPPQTGLFGFDKCRLESATDIILGTSGTATLFINNCLIKVTDGFIFNVAQWTGRLNINDTQDIGSTINGVINNPSGSADVFLNNSGLGAGNGKLMSLQGSKAVIHFCKINCITLSNADSLDMFASSCTQNFEIGPNTQGLIFNCVFSTSGVPAITYASVATTALIQSTVASDNSPAIDGGGPGSFDLENVVFLENREVTGAFTKNRFFSLFGTVSTNELEITEGANARMGTAVLAAGTVTVANNSVTANTRIFLTSQVDGGTPGFIRVSARVASTSFTITSGSGADTSTIGWLLIEPA